MIQVISNYYYCAFGDWSAAFYLLTCYNNNYCSHKSNSQHFPPLLLQYYNRRLNNLHSFSWNPYFIVVSIFSTSNCRQFIYVFNNIIILFTGRSNGLLVGLKISTATGHRFDFRYLAPLNVGNYYYHFFYPIFLTFL